MPTQFRPSGGFRSRRNLLKAGGALVAVAWIPALAQRSNAIVQPDAGSPPASPAASPQASPDAHAEITIGFTTDLRFDPDIVTVAPGTAVTWINESPLPHTATGDPEQNPINSTKPELVQLPDGAEPWGSELLQPGDRFSHVFTTPGTYEYICVPHVLAGMVGTIVVE